MRALNNVSGHIDRGEIVAISGSSGAGKTTLLNILGLSDHRYHGDLFFEDKSMPKDPASAIKLRRHSIGYISGGNGLLPMLSVLENVAYPLSMNGYSKKQRTEMAVAILSSIGMETMQKLKPMQLTDEERLAVGIAKSMVHRPKLVIGDELTTGLASPAAYSVIEMLLYLAQQQNITLVLATQDPRLTHYCDYAIELHMGEKMAERRF
ncbi:ABC transporter ATP-binding protein [Thaumasiovibrio subtropicus]|uniref:ABC transporter ATP-binding protein n=1 Tax=Thaumasiovibrio subtropicus TaxID=1891207 RepID=UPI00131D1E98|nr:ATP-binding cassette domain-containing protein [Thaumasiovibrio subtropicus]